MSTTTVSSVTEITPRVSMSMPYLSVLYNDSNPESYEGVQVVLGDKGAVVYSGDPVLDYLCAMLMVPPEWREAGFMCSSSCDHFVMDGGILEPEDGEYSEEDFAKARQFLHDHQAIGY